MIAEVRPNRHVRVFDSSVYNTFMCSASDRDACVALDMLQSIGKKTIKLNEYDITSEVGSLIPQATFLVSATADKFGNRITRIAPSDKSLWHDYFEDHKLSIDEFQPAKNSGRLVFVRKDALTSLVPHDAIINLGGKRPRIATAADAERSRRRRAQYAENKRLRRLDMYG